LPTFTTSPSFYVDRLGTTSSWVLKLEARVGGREMLRLASRCGLTEALEKPAHILSAGQAKAVSIVRTLLLKPKLLALDEPFSFLDTTRARLVLEDVKLLAEEGSTVVISTHYMYGDLVKIANSVIEIINGDASTTVARSDVRP
jgi:ABC-type multidrug transport system ATPase subunit